MGWMRVDEVIRLILLMQQKTIEMNFKQGHLLSKNGKLIDDLIELQKQYSILAKNFKRLVDSQPEIQNMYEWQAAIREKVREIRATA